MKRLDRKGKAMMADAWSCTGIEVVMGFAVDEIDERRWLGGRAEEGSEGTCGTRLSDITAMLQFTCSPLGCLIF